MPTSVSLLAGGRVLEHTLPPCSNHCSLAAPPTHPHLKLPCFKRDCMVKQNQSLGFWMCESMGDIMMTASIFIYSQLSRLHRKNSLAEKFGLIFSSSPSRQSIWLSPRLSACKHTPVLQRKLSPLQPGTHAEHSVREETLKLHKAYLWVFVWFTLAAHLVTSVPTVVNAVTSLAEGHTLGVHTLETTFFTWNTREGQGLKRRAKHSTITSVLSLHFTHLTNKLEIFWNRISHIS